MASKWTPLNLQDDSGRKLVSETCRVMNCLHGASVAADTLLDRPRAVRITCMTCERVWFVKRFSTDVAEAQVQELRSSIEFERLVELEALGLTEGSERFPKALTLLGAPYFAVVEEYFNLDELLETVHKAVLGESGPLYSALQKLAALLARLHQKRRYSAPIELDIDSLQILRPGEAESNDRTILLNKLFEAWRAEFATIGPTDLVLVHDGFTPLNVLYSHDRDLLVVTDVETVHVGSHLIDVGNTTAELKFTFAVHSGKEDDAEPFIAFFLREYYRLRDLDGSFAHLSFTQTYFMGRGLFHIAKGKWLDHSLQRWTADAGLMVWKAVLRKNEVCHPRFQEVHCVLFDFYNTLVEIEADDGDIANFEAIQQLLLTYSFGQVQSADLIRETYFNAIQEQLHASSEVFPEINSEQVWAEVLEQCWGTKADASGQDQQKVISEVMLTFRRAARRSFHVASGALELISDLKTQSISVGVVSDAQRIYLEDEIGRAGLAPLIDTIVISSDFGFRKPDRRLFLHALESVGAKPEQAVFVGDDMRHDIFGAQGAGLRAIFCPSAYGLRMFERAVPDAVIKSLNELRGLI